MWVCGVQLKTTQADGLIMFSGQLFDTKGRDFIAIELHDGHARYVFDVGSGVRSIQQDRLSRPINDNQWHEVSRRIAIFILHSR